MRILITLCARGGSKGIPGKNIRPINGVPLIGYSISTAKSFANKFKANIALSTDSEIIKKTTESFGIITSYIRPAILATDEAGKLGAIKDLIRYEEEIRNVRYDYILDLDISSPLRNLNDLESAFEIICEDEHALNLFSVNPANRNPYFNMVEQQPNGYYGLIKKGDSLTRQSAPKVYDLNASFYFYRRSFFDSEIPVVNQFSMIYVMPHLCFDLDHEFDFKFMEFLIANNQLGFDL